ncbi:MAG: type II toxin-antitoxin system VapB family antitoxin [Candidatus Binatia bacterium]
MKTTIEIPDALLAEARRTAAQEKTTLRALVEEALRETLRKRQAKKKPYHWPNLSVGGQGLTPEMEARGGWANIRKAAYPGFFVDDVDITDDVGNGDDVSGNDASDDGGDDE